MFQDLGQHGKAWEVPMDYPAGIERQVVLKNGETVRIRPIRPDDEPRLVALYDRLSRHTAYQRFFAHHRAHHRARRGDGSLRASLTAK
ncbi:MAG TPA: hypothetical protein VGT00_20780 [Methylomirabilota bacterium]|nr:hypothetical protein [Methylomirabilota bacterium]